MTRSMAAVLLLVFSTASLHAAERCGDRADAVLFKVETWLDLGAYWDSFPGCNDGYFGEHISELVATWLSGRPAELTRLNDASKKYPALMALVTRHIGIITSRARMERIKANAERSCPAGSEETCAAILARVREVEREVEAELARERKRKD